MRSQQKLSVNARQPINAVLEHLSGPSLGLETHLDGDQLEVSINPKRLLTITVPSEGSAAVDSSNVITRLVRAGGTYKLEALGNVPIWVNGRRVNSAELINSDIIEFGEKGPLSRFRLLDSASHQRRFFTEICDDCWDYLKTSRRPLRNRAISSVGVGLRRLTVESTMLFRTVVVFFILLLGFTAFQQHRINVMQQMELTRSQGRIDNFAQILARAKREALTSSHLAELENALSRDLDASISRLNELEKRSIATETVIGKSASSVVFLQGSYGYREASSGRMMRHILAPDGKPLITAGVPLLSLDGKGPLAERHYTGTGFAVADGTILVTNRHVAVPWKTDDSGAGISSNGLEPFMIKLIAYSPGLAQAKQLQLLKVSTDSDLALLRLAPGEKPLLPLPVAASPAVQGGSVIVMGYPTGLRSMVIRAGTSFIEQLKQSNKTGFWEIAGWLAEKNLIKPLASRGIVAQLTTEFLVYDAATTKGGSGGPVLNSRGEVVAVNAAILPEYGGSNLGVPAQRLHQLINEAGIQLSASLEN